MQKQWSPSEFEGLLGQTACLLHQRRRLLPGVKEVSEQFESALLYLMVVRSTSVADGVAVPEQAPFLAAPLSIGGVGSGP